MLEKIKKEIAEISEKIMDNNVVAVGTMSEKLSSIKFWEIIRKPSANIFPGISQKNN